MSVVTRAWLKGLIAAVVSASAHAITAVVAVNVLDPRTFNTGTGLWRELELASSVALLNGVSALGMYLSKSPLPTTADDAKP